MNFLIQIHLYDFKFNLRKFSLQILLVRLNGSAIIAYCDPDFDRVRNTIVGITVVLFFAMKKNEGNS